jgi:putative ABC transport system permease protein
MAMHTYKGIWARKRRLIGAGFAVVIGVAFLTATLALGDGMRGGIHSLFGEGHSGTDTMVRSTIEIDADENSSRGPIDESWVGRLAALPEVDQAIPEVEGLAQIVKPDGELIGGNGPPTFGRNWVDYDRNPYVLVEGRAPSGPSEVVIDRGSADDAGLHAGDTATILAPAPIEVTVAGVAELRSGSELGGVTFTWFDTDTAQQLLLGSDTDLVGVKLTAADSVSPEQLAAAVTPVLGDRMEAVTGATLTAEDDEAIGEDFLDFFEAFLLAFAGVAMIVACFSIHNTLTILVAQRTRESALLRAIGASRRQVLGSVAIEALTIGVVASAIGIAAGVGLAHGLRALMDAVGFGIPMKGLTASTSTIVTGMIVGVVATMVASIAPAIKASRVAPIAALRDVAVDRSGVSKVRAVLGTLITGAGIATVVTAADSPDNALALVGLGSLLSLIGVVLVGPVVARLAAGSIGLPVAIFGRQSGRLARRNAMRNPRRTAGTASALMIGTAVVAVFATFGASIKQTLDDLVSGSFEGDLVVAQEGFSGAGLSHDFALQVDQLPEVGTAGALAFANATVDGREDEPLAVDPRAVDELIDLDVLAGSVAEMDRDGIAISSGYAEEHGAALGDTMQLGFADGATTTVTVQAVFENDDILDDVLIDRAVWAPHSGRADDFMVMVSAADGVDIESLRNAVDGVGEGFGAPAAQDRDEYLDTATEEVDQMLSLVYGLLALAILIALLGIANTMALSLHERTRELGLLRAVGQTRRQLRRTVRWESVIIAVFGTVGGLGLGTFLGWGLMRAMKASEGIGQFAAPIPTLVTVLVAAAVAGIVAAARPARRASKLDVLQAISTD